MMTGGDGSADLGSILNLQIVSPLTGTHVGFFQNEHQDRLQFR